MKKQIIIKLLVSMISLVLILGTLASCQKQPTNSFAEYVTICDFENVDQLQSINFVNDNRATTGKASVNTDPKYITSGKGSMKLEVTADPKVAGFSPNIKLQFKSKYASESNFEQTSQVSVDIYNAEDTNITIFYYLGSKDDNNVVMTTSSTEYVLNANSWNNLVIKIDRAELAEQLSIKWLQQLVILLPSRSNDSDPIPILYFDNCKVKKTQLPYTARTQTKTKGEIAFFENASEISAIKTTKGANLSQGEPQMSLNRNLDYVTQGTGSLKVTVKGTQDGSRANSWPGIKWSGSALSGITDWKGSPTGDAVSEFSNFVTDIFNASPRVMEGALVIEDTNNLQYSYLLSIQSGIQKSIIIPMSSIKSNSSGALLKLESIKEMKIWIYGFASSQPDMVYYIDNIKLA